MTPRGIILAVSFWLMVVTAGCVNTKQLQLDAPLQAASQEPDQFVLESEAVLRARHARDTVLRPGTQWVEAGSISHGTVYRTRDQAVILNSFDVHEAWVVISGDHAVGYYLPVRRTYVPIEPVPLQQERPIR